MLAFDVLCDKSRQGRKLAPIPPNYSIVSFDPGETTGFATFQHYKLVTWAQYATPDLASGTVYFESLIEAYKPDLIITEDYRVYSTHLKQHEWSELLTPKLVGLLEVLGTQRKVPVVKQMAGRIKTFVDDDKLSYWKMYIKGQRHARDAIRHACFFLAFGVLPDGQNDEGRSDQPEPL